jgi:hypothetical protein
MSKDSKKIKTRDASGGELGAKHLRVGWYFVALYLTMGLCLEVMHGFKVDWYLNVSNETRRLMFTLAHSHGTLLGILHIVFGLTLKGEGASEASWARRAGACLTGAAILLPGGFLLGGIVIYAGDPGRGVLLVPIGAVLLLFAVVTTALNLRKN